MRQHAPTCSAADEDGGTLAWLAETQERIRAAELQFIIFTEQVYALFQPQGAVFEGFNTVDNGAAPHRGTFYCGNVEVGRPVGTSLSRY